ncbi:MAG TPA: DUF5686 and carboxypeptidase regulatory-like domain-containing protein [Flavitalea sp.]|nr:DUF5686 and carboxypeptidase regulatory-like domain-containing protein [Flavitalea sp.]
MNKKIFLILLCGIFCSRLFAGRISGSVTDDKGKPLPFASILVKGTTRGTTANSDGKYFLTLDDGRYTLSCQYVGFNKQERTITVSTETIQVDFSLTLQQLSLASVVIRPGMEDPAYEIIRNAIRKRKEYLAQLDRFQCQVYIKGQVRLRSYPKKFLGEEIDFEDGDTSKKKMIYLSETIANYSVQKPNKAKIEVLSTKVSGEKNGFGLGAPQILSFYENIISIGSNLNPRGFVSPIANNALSLYRYKYEGSFFEDGKEVNRIRVIAKRKFEPVFTGYINITEGDWRIHSLQLMLTKESQMEIIDTLRIEQLYVPYDATTWVIKSQVIYPAAKMFGFDAYGSFVNIYSQFNTDPVFAKKFFGNTYLKFYDSANKKPSSYWDSIRPIALQPDEIIDYHKKDSLEQVRKDPRYLDSLDRKRNKITLGKVLQSGITFSNSKSRTFVSIQPLIQSVSFNTVEGLVLHPGLSFFKRLDSNSSSRRSIGIGTSLRYGFSNHHFNGSVNTSYSYGRKYFSNFFINGGKQVFQFNNASALTERQNTITTLLWERNYMKIYEAPFIHAGFSKGIGEGLTIGISVQYQDRHPLENTTTTKWRDRKDVEFTPNFPQELLTENMLRHQAFMAAINIRWQPGGRYIEFPERTISIGSKYPVLSFTYTRGIHGWFGSDIDYDKWRFAVSDNLNLKLGGRVNYRFTAGGFIRNKKVQVPDFTHFNGNQLLMASPYLASFQLAPYYKYSNTNAFYTTGHLEHHLNGLLTNKIPLFRKLNWHLVTGVNAFYVNKNVYYLEAFAGLENILKVLRVDVIHSFEPSGAGTIGVRIGLKGALTGN